MRRTMKQRLSAWILVLTILLSNFAPGIIRAEGDEATLGDIFTFVSLQLGIGEDVTPINSGDVIEITNGTEVTLTLEWDIAGKNAKNGDTAAHPLPDLFKWENRSGQPLIVTDEDNVPIKIGTYSIIDGNLIFTFNEEVERDDQIIETGQIKLGFEFDVSKFQEDIIQELPYKEEGDKNFTIISKPNGAVQAIQKNGVPNRPSDATSITWTIDILNNTDSPVTGATLSDLIPAGLSLDTDSFQIAAITSKYNATQGVVVRPDAVDASAYTLNTIATDEATFEYSFGEIEPYSGYRVTYTTAIDDLSVATYINDAVYTIGDNEYEAKSPVDVSQRSNPIEKSGYANHDSAGFSTEDKIHWVIDVNKSGSVITGATVADTLPAYTTLTPGSIVIVKLVRNGDTFTEAPSTLTADSFPIALGDLGANDIYRIKYSTDIDYSLVNDGEYVSSSLFKNVADLLEGGKKIGTDEADVTVTRKPILSKQGTAANYNHADQSLTWTVHVNEARHNLTDVVVTDYIPVGLSITADDIVIKNELGVDVTATIGDIAVQAASAPNEGKTEVVIDLGDINKEKYTIEYKTKVTNFATNSFVNGVGMDGDGVGTGGVIPPVTVNPPTNTFVKNHKTTDYAALTMSWEMVYNPVREKAIDLRIEDSFPDNGMILLPGTLEVFVGNASTALDRSNYTLSPRTVDGDTGYHLGFVIDFDFITTATPLNSLLTVKYKTSFDPEVVVEGDSLLPLMNTAKEYKNTAIVTGLSTTQPILLSDNASTVIRDDAWNTGKKTAQLVNLNNGSVTTGWKSGEERLILWDLYINYYEQNLGTGVIIEDALQFNGEIIDNLLIQEYVVNSDGTTSIKADSILSSDYYDFDISEDGKSFELVFAEGFAVNKRYVISYYSTVDDESRQNYSNEATMKASGKTNEYKATVGYTNYNNFIEKKMDPNAERVYTGDEVQWKVDLNKSLSVIANALITDTISKGHVYLNDSLKLKKWENGVLVDLVKGTDYNYAVTAGTNETQNLTIEFLKTIDQHQLQLTYTTVVTEKNGVINNAITLNGNSKEIKSVITDKVNARQFSSTDGTVQPAKGYLELTKIDKDTKSAIVNHTGVQFSLWYELNGERVQLGDNWTMDASGKVTIPNLNFRTYWIREEVAPVGYVPSSEFIEVVVNKSKTAGITTLTVENEKKKMDFFLRKRGENLLKDEIILPGVAFKLQIKNGSSWTDTLFTGTTDENGELRFEDVPYGEYRLVETTPAGYRAIEPIVITKQAFLDEYAADSNANRNLEYSFGTIKNEKQRGSVEFTKVSSYLGTPLAGVTFAISKGTDIATATAIGYKTTDANGYIRFDDLELGDYILSEVTRPDGHIKLENVTRFTINADKQVKKLDNVVNQANQLKITKFGPANVIVPGTKFEIVKLVGDDEILYGEYTTNAVGEIVLNAIPDGNYLVREIVPAAGYVLGTEVQTFSVTTGVISPTSLRFTNEKTEVVIKKIDAENDTILRGVTFVITGPAQGSPAVSTWTRTTDVNGLITMTGLIPGTYTYAETATVDGYVLDETEHTFTIDVNGAVTGANFSEGFHVVTNEKTSVTINKVDAQGSLLDGAVLKLESTNLDDFEVRELTVTDGSITLRGLVAGTYELSEVTQPDGYILSDEVIVFTLDEYGVIKIDGESVDSVDFTNDETTVVIEKHNTAGAGLADAQIAVYDADRELIETLTTDALGQITLTGYGSGTYYYKELVPPAGYVLNPTEYSFTIDAAGVVGEVDPIVNEETLVTIFKLDAESGVGLEETYFELYIVDEESDEEDWLYDFSTQEDGLVELTGLTPGQYRIYEYRPTPGYVLNTEVFWFEIDQYGHVIVDGEEADSIIFTNMQTELVISKIDSATGLTVPGAVIELYRFNLGIQTYSDDDSVYDEFFDLVDSYTLVSGSHTFRGLTPGIYYYTELTAPDGYIKSDEKHLFFVDEDGLIYMITVDEETGTLTLGEEPITELTLENDPTVVTIWKTDTVDEFLPGALVQVASTTDDSIVVTGITGEDGSVTFERLPIGTYELTELTPPAGYELNTETYEFTIDEQGVVTGTTTIVNEMTTVVIKKVDEAGEALAGAMIGIYNEAGQLMGMAPTNEDGEITLRGYEPGTYSYRELTPPAGYVLNTETYEFTIDENGIATETAVIENEQTVVTITKEDAITKDPVAGSTVELLLGTEVIGRYFTDAFGQITWVGLEPGTYTYREVAAPTGYTLNLNSFSFTIDVNGSVSGQLSFENDLTELLILKTDIAGKALANVGFQIRSTSGVALKFERVGTAYRPAVDGTETLYTDANGSITINGLAYGSYDVVETEALAGYVSIAPERITLSAEKAQIELTLVNEQTVLEIHKTDPYNKPMAGIGFSILDANGKRLTFVKTNGVYTLSANGLALVQTDENGLIVIHGLPLGEYTLEETVTPSAYVAIAPRSFTISDGSTAAKPHIEKVVNQLAPTPPVTPTPAPTDPTETDPSGNEGEGIGPTDPTGPTTPGVNKPPLTGDLGGNLILFLLVSLAAAFVFGGVALWLHERKLSKRHDHR